MPEKPRVPPEGRASRSARRARDRTRVAHPRHRRLVSPSLLAPSSSSPLHTTQDDIDKLRGSLLVKHTLATHGAEKLWELCTEEPYVPALGALTGGQAVQSVRAGLKAIYCSGWQVAADANSTGNVYPDQSLYAVDSVPKLVSRINKALQRADQVEHAEVRGRRAEMAEGAWQGQRRQREGSGPGFLSPSKSRRSLTLRSLPTPSPPFFFHPGRRHPGLVRPHRR